MYRPFCITSGLQDQGFRIFMLLETGSTNQYPTILGICSHRKNYIYKYQYLSKPLWLCMLFLLWFCSPLPRRGLLVRVRFLVKGRVCRSPFCIKFLSLHPSRFCYCYTFTKFHDPVDTSPKCWKTFSIKASHVCVITSEFLLALCFCHNEVLLKRGFGGVTGCICLILSCPTLSSRKCVCISAEWLEQGSECSYQQEDLGSVFQWNQESKDPNHAAI